MLLLYINLGDRNPPYHTLASNIPSARSPRQRFHFLQCRGPRLLGESSLRKQAWKNPKEGRAGCTKVNDIAFTSDFCNNYSHPASLASLYLTSPRARPTRPRVPYLMSSSPSSRVPKSQVPTHASRCPRPLVPVNLVPLLYTATQLYRRERIHQVLTII